MVEVKPIRTEEDYDEALKTIEAHWDTEKGTPEGDLFEILVILVEDFESKHYPIDPPDPISAIEYMMDVKGLTRKNLEPFIGSSKRVSEVMDRKKPLTLKMIRKLHQGLGIPVDVLVQDLV